MTYHRLTVKLIVAFTAAVLIPGIVLGIIAARALRHEESYLEGRLEDTLRVEVDGSVELIQSEIAAIGQKLDDGLRFAGGENPRDVLRAWQKGSTLVEFPFLVSRDNRLLWPAAEAKISPEEDAFLASNRGFLTGESTILAFENVALLPDQSPDTVARAPASAAPVPPAKKAEEVDLRKALAGQGLKDKVAVARFRGDEAVQSRLYEQAEQEEKQVLQRNVLPRQEGADDAVQDRSILVAEPLDFAGITSGAAAGFIPRLTGKKLELFFWKRVEPGGEIAGCQVNLERFTEMILTALPVPYSATRLLTVLDQNGEPLLDPLEDKTARDWKRPFFSREIGEVLPRWEVAAYLVDPTGLAGRARLRSLVTGVLIALLLVAILLGGFLVFRAVSQEMALAQQKTTFAANVSHELKTPLTSIRIFAEMLEKGRQPSREKQEQYLKTIVSESKRLSRLINTVLDFSLIERGEKIYHKLETDLAEVVRQVMEKLTGRLEERGFVVRIRAPRRPVRVSADPEALEQVLVNLVANAEKYSDARREIEIEVAEEGERARVTVRDRGIGVPAGAARKIFKKFYRADDRLTSRVKGTGLGLTIARAIMQEHDGDLLYSPREGGGSCFSFDLPLL
ncbi:MAG: HAMP domain-containing sensor histidine kinase [PVC group bacterium]